MLKDVDNIIATNFSNSRAFIKAEKIVIENKEILLFKVEKSNEPVYFT